MLAITTLELAHNDEYTLFLGLLQKKRRSATLNIIFHAAMSFIDFSNIVLYNCYLFLTLGQLCPRREYFVQGMASLKTNCISHTSILSTSMYMTQTHLLINEQSQWRDCEIRTTLQRSWMFSMSAKTNSSIESNCQMESIQTGMWIAKTWNCR